MLPAAEIALNSSAELVSEVITHCAATVFHKRFDVARELRAPTAPAEIRMAQRRPPTSRRSRRLWREALDPVGHTAAEFAAEGAGVDRD